MAEKSAVNLSLPDSVMAEFDRIASSLTPKQKWMVHTAAVLMLIESPESVQNHYIRAAASADIASGTFEILIERAKSGQLRSEAVQASAGAAGAKLRPQHPDAGDTDTGPAPMPIIPKPGTPPGQMGNAAFPTGATGTIPRPAGRDVNEAELSPHKKLKGKK